MPADAEAYCLLCECQYEERSTTTIKVSARARAALPSGTFQVALGQACAGTETHSCPRGQRSWGLCPGPPLTPTWTPAFPGTLAPSPAPLPDCSPPPGAGVCVDSCLSCEESRASVTQK